MMRRWFALALLLLAPAASAQNESKGQLFYDYDLDDATNYVYGAMRTAGASSGDTLPVYGSPILVNTRIKTTGSSTSVTAETAATNPFTDVAVGDVLAVRRADGTTDLRRVTVRTDANNVTVDTAVDWSSGFSFGYYDFTSGTAGTSGWFSVRGSTDTWLRWHVKQLTVTGGISVRVQCRTATLDPQVVTVWPDPTNSASTDECKKGNFTAVTDCALGVTGVWDDCRLGFKVGTSDGSITITAGVNDDIDATEGDAGAGVATLTAATYTSSTALCAEIVTQLDALAGANTYSCTYSTTTRKITLARATGAATIAFPWATGPNVATSAGATLGFTADDSGATSYVADNAIDIDEGSTQEKISGSVTIVRRVAQ